MTAAPEAPGGYRLVEESGGCARISAVDADGVQICGAYQPGGHTYWVVYLTASLTALTGRRPPHHAHVPGRCDAQAWVEAVGGLYGRAAT